MRFFVRSVASGFAFSMGAALFKKVSKKIGLAEETASDDDKVVDADADGEVDGQDDPAPAGA
jgi:hypothetical protein